MIEVHSSITAVYSCIIEHTTCVKCEGTTTAVRVRVYERYYAALLLLLLYSCCTSYSYRCSRKHNKHDRSNTAAVLLLHNRSSSIDIIAVYHARVQATQHLYLLNYLHITRVHICKQEAGLCWAATPQRPIDVRVVVPNTEYRYLLCCIPVFKTSVVLRIGY